MDIMRSAVLTVSHEQYGNRLRSNYTAYTIPEKQAYSWVDPEAFRSVPLKEAELADALDGFRESALQNIPFLERDPGRDVQEDRQGLIQELFPEGLYHSRWFGAAPSGSRHYLLGVVECRLERDRLYIQRGVELP